MPTDWEPCGLNSSASVIAPPPGRLELEHDLPVLDRLSALRDEVADRSTARRADVVADPEHLDVPELVALAHLEPRTETLGVDEEADGRRCDPDGARGCLGRGDRRGGGSLGAGGCLGRLRRHGPGRRGHAQAQVAMRDLDLAEAMATQALGELGHEPLGGDADRLEGAVGIGHAPLSLSESSSALGQISLQRGRAGTPGRRRIRPIRWRSDGSTGGRLEAAPVSR